MLGTIVNTACIILGSVIGSIAKKGIKPKYQEALYSAMGLSALLLGVNTFISHLPKSPYPVLFILSLAIGTLCGVVCDLSGRFHKLVNRYSKSQLAEGLSTGILLFCIGTLSMVGPVMSALYGDNTYLFTNATLDFVTSMVLASTYGIGMALAAPVLFLFQGSIYLVTVLAGNVISEGLMNEISIIGGVLITSSGFSILQQKDYHTLDMLPAFLIPIIFFGLKHFC